MLVIIPTILSVVKYYNNQLVIRRKIVETFQSGRTNLAKRSFIVGGVVLVFAFVHDLQGWGCGVLAPLTCNVAVADGLAAS